jgi:hypothetical protein
MESEMMSVPIQLVQDLISAQKEQDQTNQTLINAVQYLQKEMTNQKARADKLEQRNSMLSKKMKTKVGSLRL